MTVHVSSKNGVVTIRLSRPEAHNSFDLDTLQQLHRAITDAIDDESVAAIILTGTGRAFCAGADVHELADHLEDPRQHLDNLTLNAHAIVEELHQNLKPVVTAINGTAAGGGMGLALAGDLVVMAETARLVVAFPKIGLSPDSGITQKLTSALGPHLAREHLLLDRPIDADTARACGLVNHVCPAEELQATAQSLAERLAQVPPHVAQSVKHLVRLALHSPPETVLEAERRHIIAASQHDPFAKAVAAFVGETAAKRVRMPSSEKQDTATT